MIQAWRAFSWLIPFFAVFALVIAIWYCFSMKRSAAVSRELRTTRALTSLFVTYMAGLLLVTLSPTPLPGKQVFVVAPWASTALGTPTQMFMNLALFVPVGLLVTLRWRELSISRIVSVGLVLPLMVELGQYVIDGGRVASTSDALLGAAGVGAGSAIARLGLRIRASDVESGRPEEVSVGPPR